MIEEIGTITKVRPGRIWVQTQIKTTCGGCQMNNDCGTGIVARAFADKSQTLALSCDETVAVGQQVKFGIPEQTLLGASMLLYLLPLLGLVIGAAGFQAVSRYWALSGEWLTIIGAVLGLVATYAWVRYWLNQRQADTYQPTLLAVLPQPIAVTQIADGLT